MTYRSTFGQRSVAGLALAIVTLAGTNADADARNLRGHLDEISILVDARGDDVSSADEAEILDKLEDVRRILEATTPGGGDPGGVTLACFASEARPGQFYMQDIRGTDRLGNYFSSRGKCESAVQARTQSVTCFESEATLGKAFIGEISPAGSRLGNYFNSFDACLAAMDAAQQGSHTSEGMLATCFQSESSVGKAYIGKIDAANSRIGNYYASDASCLEAFSLRRGAVVCMESESQVGKWFLADLENNANRLGGYLENRDECFRILSNR